MPNMHYCAPKFRGKSTNVVNSGKIVVNPSKILETHFPFPKLLTIRVFNGQKCIIWHLHSQNVWGKATNAVDCLVKY